MVVVVFGGWDNKVFWVIGWDDGIYLWRFFVMIKKGIKKDNLVFMGCLCCGVW